MSKQTPDGLNVTRLRESKKLQTRLSIRRAALRLALEEGLENITVEAIAEAADVSPRTFFNYFESKEDALMTEDSQLAERLKQMIIDRPKTESELQAVRRSLRDFADERNLPKTRADVLKRQKLVNHHPWLKARQAAKFAQIENAIAEAVASRRGLKKPDNEARFLSALVATTVRLCFQTWAEGDRELGDIFKKYFDQLEKGFNK